MFLLIDPLIHKARQITIPIKSDTEKNVKIRDRIQKTNQKIANLKQT